MKIMTSLLSVLIITLSIMGTSQVAEAKKDFPTCSFKPSVAVDSFRTENIYIGWNEFAGNARDVVVNELVNSGCWRVVERSNTGLVSGGYDKEQAIKQAGAARPGQKSARSGQVTLADKLVQCALTGVSRNNVGGSIGGFGVGGGKFGLGKVAPKSSRISITCRIYDSSTSEVLASVEKSKSKVDIGVLGAGGGKVALGGDFFYNTPAGKTMAALIKETLVDLTKRVQKNPWSS
jgi:curli biogenesis system outer membrane secretion channel CsgG